MWMKIAASLPNRTRLTFSVNEAGVLGETVEYPLGCERGYAVKNKRQRVNQVLDEAVKIWIQGPLKDEQTRAIVKALLRN